MSADSGNSIVELLREARQDPRGLDDLFGHCRNYLLLMARAQIAGRLRTKVDASDLVQQTLLEAYRDFGRFQGTTAAEWLAWLRRILTHNALNVARHYHGTQQRDDRREIGGLGIEDSVGPALPADRGESPSAAALRKEREVQLADAIAGLPADYQEVIVLRNLQHLPFADIAERMGRSRPAVQMLWMRALEKLQEALRSLESADSNARNQ